ncbi:hypothetical protein FACS1894103_4110 [Campylobacterota bacterium]|nr:hypothetical protein FACS1894103_4110 [Campylobacterota bacterium]
MDLMVIKGYIYFFVMAVAAVLMVLYIWHLYSNKKRSEHYEGYSNVVLQDDLGTAPFEARENDGAPSPQAVKKDKR